MKLLKIKLLLFFVLLKISSFAQTQQEIDEKQRQTYRDILNSKEQIAAGVSLGISPINFAEKNNRLGNWKNITYNSQWVNFSYGSGEITKLRTVDNSYDTVTVKEFTIGANFSLKKLVYGKRLYDMHGFLVVPFVSGAIGQRTIEETKSNVAKITAGVSAQFPFCAIDLKLHGAYGFGAIQPGIRTFAFTPEIAIKIDGLYNLLDAQKVYIGHAEGTNSFKSTSYSSTSKRDGDYIITTTYKTETTTTVPYSFDRYATVIGPLVAIGPHVAFQSNPYAGMTRMYGLGYYIRLGILSSDFLFDTGKIGFASSMEETQTIEDPAPKQLAKVNKDDFSNRGSYNSNRFQVRLGVDLFEVYMSTFGSGASVGKNQTKFTRIIGGIGYGYATVSAPHYVNGNGASVADERFANDYTLLSTSGNHAKFASDGNYFTLYCSLEAGAIRLTFESNRYMNAALANVKSISVGYLIPYNRLKKKLKAIRSYEKFINE